MPRKKRVSSLTIENKPSDIQSDADQLIIDFAQEFVKARKRSNQSPLFYNPFWQNELLKNINMSPATYSREKIEQMIANPRANEDGLRDLGQYLMNTIMQFNRILNYFAGILTFDYYIVSTNADEEDIRTDRYKKSRQKVSDWLENFHLKLTLSNVMKGIMLEDAKFYYVFESDNGPFLYEMPQKYCKIIAKTEYGYQYAFNMYYFLQAGINIYDFPPEFLDYFKSFVEGKSKNDGFFYWQPLDPIKAPVFKFDENRAGITPPLLGLFLDSAEISAYKKLLKTKTQLEVWKLLLSKIPLKTDQKGARTMNEFAIDPKTAGEFSTIVQSAVPDGVAVITTPLETEAINFEQAQSPNNIVGIGQSNFYQSAGTPSTLFGDSATTNSAVSASIKTDEAYVLHMYRVFERWIRSYLKEYISKKYRFKVMFPDITHFNRKEKHELFLKSAQFGYSKQLVSVAMGVNPEDMEQLIRYENTSGFYDKLKPLTSSHVQNGSGAPGAPPKDDDELSPNGDVSRGYQ